MDIYVVQDCDYAILGVFNSLPAAHNFVLNYIAKYEADISEEPGTLSREFTEKTNSKGYLRRRYKEGYRIIQFKLNEQIYEV